MGFNLGFKGLRQYKTFQIHMTLGFKKRIYKPFGIQSQDS